MTLAHWSYLVVQAKHGYIHSHNNEETIRLGCTAILMINSSDSVPTKKPTYHRAQGIGTWGRGGGGGKHGPPNHLTDFWTESPQMQPGIKNYKPDWVVVTFHFKVCSVTCYWSFTLRNLCLPDMIWTRSGHGQRFHAQCPRLPQSLMYSYAYGARKPFGAVDTANHPMA